jgi:hypothetical protein
MSKSAPKFLADVAEDHAPDEDKLLQLQRLAVEAKAIALEIEQLEEQLSEKNRELQKMQQQTLPDLFMEIGIDEISVPATGNMPAFKATCAPFYAAGIPVKWDPERRAEAFQYLTENGAGDLIKTEIDLKFRREDRDEALGLVSDLQARGLQPELKEAVHQSTLTAWLREQIEQNNWTPDLEKIGGTVGRVVKIKEKR